MNQEKPDFFGCTLWSHFDYAISGSSFRLETFFMKDQYNLGPLRLKVGIYHQKNGTKETMYLDYQSIFSFLTVYKKTLDGIGETISRIDKDHEFQSATLNIVNSKRKMFITFLYKLEYIAPCARVIISDKNEGFADSEKIYIPYMDFMSLIKLMADYKNSYLTYATNLVNISVMDDISKRITNVDAKIENYYKEIVHFRNTAPAAIEKKEVQLDPLVQSTPLTTPEIDVIQDSFNSFIAEKAPLQTLDLPKNFSLEENRPDPVYIQDKDLVKEFLTDDIQNIEVYLNGVLSDISPFNKFCDIIKNKTDIDLTSGMDPQELCAFNYYTSLNIKNAIQLSITKKMSLPKGAGVFLFSKIDSDEQKINIVYDLLLFLLYYSNIRNLLIDKNQNMISSKDMIVFILKNMIISFAINLLIVKLEPEVIISNLQKRYSNYKARGIFDKLEESLKIDHGISGSLNATYFNGEIERISKSMKTVDQNLVKFPSLFETFVASKNGILDYSVFQNNNFTIEQIKKLLALEFNFRSSGKVEFEKITEFRDFSDIPQHLLEKYGIENKKYNNDNLKRFLALNQKSYPEVIQKVVAKVNESYRDLSNETIDLNLLEELSLKAIYLWDILKDSRITIDYLYFDELVRNCSLTKDVLLSLLTNIQKEEKVDVMKQFIASRED